MPLTDRPKLKNRAWTENRAESGHSPIAKGSSNDASTSRCVKEPSHSEGALFQSNSILGRIVNQTPMQCNDNVNTRGAFTCQMNNQLTKQNGHRTCRWPLSALEIRLVLTLLGIAGITKVVDEDDQGQEEENHDDAYDHRKHTDNNLSQKQGNRRDGVS